MKVCTLIITHNRINRLTGLMQALQSQTYNDFDTIILDTGNIDGINNLVGYLNTRIKYEKHEAENRDEAYREAFRIASESKYDFLWLLHDDVIPDNKALEELLKGAENAEFVSCVTSTLRSESGSSYFVPEVIHRRLGSENIDWIRYLEYGLIGISKSSLASILINVDSIRKCGVPTQNDTFGDNSSYIKRLIRDYGPAYLSGKSKVLHYKKVSVSEKPKVCAIIVTYNRKNMLGQCLDALIKQSYREFDILIVDNASTDGTYEYIQSYLSHHINYVNTGDNLGGSGGFYYGMKYAYEKGYDWLWIMDDDVIPTENALYELIDHTKYSNKFSFLASAVYSKDERAMNTPEISRFATNGYKFWYDKLNHGMIRLAHATFVSLLINTKAIKACGLPCKDYFIWGDDTEYTMRLIGKFGAAYMVGASKVYHLRNGASALNIFSEKDPKRISMFYYMIRNTLVNTKFYFGKKACKNAIKRYYKDCLKIALKTTGYRVFKIRTILKGIRDFKKENYDINAFKNRYKFYGQEKAVVSFIGSNDLAECLEKKYGYSVRHNLQGCSIFTALESVPAYVKEFEGADNGIYNEITRTYISTFNDVEKQEFLVIDLQDSCNLIGYFMHDDEIFDLSLNKTIKECLAKSDIEWLKVPIDEVEPSSLNDEQLLEYVRKFILAITKYYSQDRIVLVKRDITMYSESDATLLIKLYSMFLKLLPQVKVINESEYQNKDDKLESLISIINR